MNDEDGLEPTIAMPRVQAPPRPAGAGRVYDVAAPPAAAAVPVAAAPPAPAPAPPAPYVFGNPLGYVVRRGLAFVVDVVLVTAVATLVLYGLIAINPLTGLPNNSEGGFDATFSAGVAIALLAIWLSEALFGTTLGKLAFGLHVFARGQRSVGLGRALVRSLLRPVDLIAIGGVLALLPGHRRLGDLFGGTVVARSPMRGFAPLVGWVLIVALAAVPFFVAGGPITMLAALAAFVEFVPPLVAHALDAVLALFGAASPSRTGAPLVNG